MAQAFVTLLESQMGGGKTNTSTAFVVDDYFAHIYGIENKGIPSKSYEVKPYKLNFVKLVPSERIVKIPSDWDTYSTTKIFANHHLYGVRYMYAPMHKVLDYINTPIMKDAKWIIDEGWLAAESRSGMNPLVKFITEYSQLMRKLNVEMFWLTQHARFLDWRIRFITKRKIITEYDEKTHYIKLLIQNIPKGTEITRRYYAPTYWPFFDTNEVPPMPTAAIEKARKYT